ncbi:MAG TPA: glucuronyl hydrolase, partial [Niastella sp.]
MKQISTIFFAAVFLMACNNKPAETDIDSALHYCITQANKTLKTLPADSALIPRSIANGKTDWRFVNYRDWTCGFWPGIL